MGMSLLCLAILQGQSRSVDWNPKEIRLPEDLTRVQFEVYMPDTASAFTLQKALLVWVPQLQAFPGRPGRQALRLTLKGNDGRSLDIFAAPSISAGCYANIGQIIGQGYLSFSLTRGMTLITIKKGDVCLGLISKDFSADSLNTLAKNLQAIEE